MFYVVSGECLLLSLQITLLHRCASPHTLCSKYMCVRAPLNSIRALQPKPDLHGVFDALCHSTIRQLGDFGIRVHFGCRGC